MAQLPEKGVNLEDSTIDNPVEGGFIFHLEKAIEDNLRNEQFGVEELATIIGLSRSQVHRKLKISTGKSVSQFIREYRLERAMELLKSESGTASDISYRVGFGSPTYFNKCFKEYFGVPPGEARNVDTEDLKQSLESAKQSAAQLKLKRNLNPVLLLIGVFLIGLVGLLFLDDDQGLPPLEHKTLKQSIAVLPFKNLSHSEESQYFSDGVMDAILTDLVQYGEFKVISRTSVEQYRSTLKPIKEISAELNVTHILEGSVQRDSNRIRVIVQLIKADDDNHLWAKTYDREITDVFRVQSEIAGVVASELRGEIIGEETLTDPSIETKNPAAYDAYLKGQQYHTNFFYRRNESDLLLARDLYRRALAEDPDFLYPKNSLGWVLLDRVRFLGEGVELYDSAILLATQLNRRYPDRSDVLTLLGTAYRYRGQDYDLAETTLTKAVTLNPYYWWGVDLLGWYYGFTENRRDMALILHERASELEPFNPELNEAQGWHWMQFGEYEKARLFFEKSRNMQPDYIGAYLGLAVLHITWKEDYNTAIGFLEQALTYNPGNLNLYNQIAQYAAWQGDFDKSKDYFRKVIDEIGEGDYVVTRNAPWWPARYGYTLWQLGEKELAKDYLQKEIRRGEEVIKGNISGAHSPIRYQMAGALAFLGDKAKAYQILNDILENDDWGDPAYLAKDPLFEGLRGEPQLKDYIKRYQARMTEQQRNYERLKEMDFEEVLRSQ